MMHRKIIVSVVVFYALMAMLFTGDTGKAAISAGNSMPAALPGAAQTPDMETSDDRLAAIAKQVPGFGGLFLDKDGTLQVYMLGQKEPASASMISLLDDVIAREIGGGERLSGRGVEILEVPDI